MARFEPTSEQLRKITKKAANVVDRSIAGGLDPEAVCESLQDIYTWKNGIPSTSAEVALSSRIYKYPGGSIALMATRFGLTDEEIINNFKKAGWKFTSPWICSSRRIKVPKKSEVAIGVECMLTIKNIIPVNKAWEFQEIEDIIGAPTLAFDLEDLHNFVLGNEEQLVENGIRWIVAPGAHFKSGSGSESIVYANIESKELYLNSIKTTCTFNEWFGFNLESFDPCESYSYLS